MYAQKFKVNVVIRGESRACPLEWLDQFCMRNFTNAAEFDDTLPVADGRVEASFRVTPERFAEGFGAWLTQRGKGEGQARTSRSDTRPEVWKGSRNVVTGAASGQAADSRFSPPIACANLRQCGFRGGLCPPRPSPASW